MSRPFHVAVALVLITIAAPAGAQEDAAVDSTTAAVDEAWHYRSPMPRAATPSLARQKAALRGQQRMARLDAMRWYGFSNSRPTASGMPWTTMYSPAWQMPGGRPFAWYTSSRPIVIINGGPSAVYR